MDRVFAHIPDSRSYLATLLLDALKSKGTLGLLSSFRIPLVLILLFLLPSGALAATFNVTNLNDTGAGSLRQAINASNDGDTIIIDAALSGTINLSSALPALDSVTLTNANDITLSRTTGHERDAPLEIGDGKTVTGTLPSTTVTLDGSYATGLYGSGSFTLASSFASTITTTSSEGAYGILSLNDMTLDDFTGTVRTVANGNSAYGIYSAGGSSDITVGDITGNITIEAATSGFGISATRDLTIGDFSGAINVTGQSTGYGLRANEGSMVTGDLTGNITVNTGSDGYGVSSFKNLTIDDVTGTVRTESTGGSAYGLIGRDDVAIASITGTVHAETDTDTAYGVYGGDKLSVPTISGTVTAIADGKDAFGIYSGDSMDLGTVSGTIKAEAGTDRAIGIYSLDSLDNGAGGATVISGTITAKTSGLAVGIGVEDGMNINVTNSITATDTSNSGKAYAIAAGRANESSWSTGGNIDDTVTIADGVNLGGHIELGGGTNQLTFGGAHTVTGNINGATTLTKNGAGTLDVSGDIQAGDLNLSAGKIILNVTQINNPTLDVTNTLTNDGEITLNLDAFIPGGQTVTVVSAGNPLAGAGTYTNNSRLVTIGQTATSVTLTKTDYSEVITPGDSDLSAFASALSTGSGSATDSMKTILNQMEGTATDAEFSACVDQLRAQPLGALPALGIDAAQAATQATQTRMAEMRSYQIMLAEQSNNLDPDDPETWPMLAALGDLSGLLARSPEEKPNGVHLRIVGTTGGMDSYDDHDGYDYNTLLFSGGYDQMRGDNFLMGVSGGYSITVADYDDVNESSSEMQSFNLGLYGSMFEQNWYFDALLAWAYNTYETARPIAFRSVTATAETTGLTLSAKTNFGYRFDLPSVGMTPIASLEYTRFHQQGYTESGAGAANLRVPAANNNSLESGLGVKIDTSLNTDSWRIIPEISATWQHEWLTQDQSTTYSMTGMPGTKFLQTTAESPKDSMRLSTAVTTLNNDGLAMSIKYQGDIEEHAGSHSLMLETQWAF